MRGGNQKLRLIYLYKLFLTETDEQHPLTRAELTQMLQNRYNIEMERKTFYDDLSCLQELGADIAKGEARGTYFLAARDFESPELHLLVDAIQSSQFITEKKSRTLIEKLTTLCSRHEGDRLKQGVRLARRNKTANEGIFYNIDAIYRSITMGRQLSFLYFNWDLQGGKLVRTYRHDGARYVVSPIAVLWDDEKYYLVAFDSKSQQMRHYRVDKMERLTIEEAPRDGGELLENFDSGKYAAQHFGMYGGETMSVTLRYKREMLGVAVDRFGKEARIRPDGEDHFLLTAEVTVSPQFYGWLFSLEDNVELIAPQEAVDKLKALLSDVHSLYERKQK